MLVKPLQQLERENDELRQVGIDLYERAEQWRKALQEIGRFNRDPVIASIIRRNLNE